MYLAIVNHEIDQKENVNVVPGYMAEMNEHKSKLIILEQNMSRFLQGTSNHPSLCYGWNWHKDWVIKLERRYPDEP